MLFAWNRAPRALHFAATVTVTLGTTMSAFWILSANSWMHTPVGHEMHAGVAYPIDWFTIVFNPSFLYRLAHMLNASYLTAGFVVLAVGARYLIARRYVDEARTMLRDMVRGSRGPRSPPGLCEQRRPDEAHARRAR